MRKASERTESNNFKNSSRINSIDSSNHIFEKNINNGKPQFLVDSAKKVSLQDKLRKQIKNNSSIEMSKQNTTNKILGMIGDDDDDPVNSITHYRVNNHISSMKELEYKREFHQLSPEKRYY